MERYVLNTTPEVIEETFGIFPDSPSLLEPNFNTTPGQTLPVIFWKDDQPHIEMAIWDSSVPFIHIQKEEKMALRAQLHQPCIVPVTGFYIWKQTVNDPLPFFVRIHSREILGIAGILLESDGGRKQFKVLIRDANVLLKPLDDTMPCILEPDEYSGWIHEEASSILNNGFSHNLFMPDMTVFRVPDLVNDVRNNSKELIQPIPKLREDD